jgi:hypothetical protein
MQKLLAVGVLGICAGLASNARAQARDVNAGPIWNQADAEVKCPRVCKPPARWNGLWRTTVAGKMSVCGCVGGPVVIGAPPPRHPVVAPPTVVEPAPVVVDPPPPRPVLTTQPPPPAPLPPAPPPPQPTAVIDVVGEYDAQHPDWTDTVRIKRDGRFHRGSGDGGSWSFDGKVLTLAWDNWGPAHLWLKPDGVFFDREQRFRLVRRAGPGPGPMNRTPPQMVGTYDGVHPQWRDLVILGADGRYQRGNGDPGSWWFDGTALHLKWDRWGESTLMAQPDGSYFDARQNFRLAAHVAAPPPPPPPRELRSQYLRLDRAWYKENDQPIVYWDGLPQNNMAWVSVVPRGAADGEWGDWTYTRAAISGSFTLTRPLAAGDYEVRAYSDAMSPVMDRLPFRVSPPRR